METYITYDLKPVEGGFMARCTATPMATAFGRTADEAGDNLVEAISGYIKEYPERRDDLLGVPVRTLKV